jgi:hypothetical protein
MPFFLVTLAGLVTVASCNTLIVSEIRDIYGYDVAVAGCNSRLKDLRILRENGWKWQKQQG